MENSKNNDSNSARLKTKSSYDYNEKPLYFKNFRKNKINVNSPWKSIFVIKDSTLDGFFDKKLKDYRNLIDNNIYLSDLSKKRIRDFLDFYFPLNLSFNPVRTGEKVDLIVYNRLDSRKSIDHKKEILKTPLSIEIDPIKSDFIKTIPNFVEYDYVKNNYSSSFPKNIDASDLIFKHEIIKSVPSILEINTIDETKNSKPINVLVDHEKYVQIKPSFVNVIPTIPQEVIISTPRDIEIEPLSVKTDIPLEISVSTIQFETSIPSYIDVIPNYIEPINLKTPSFIDIIPVISENSLTQPSEIEIVPSASQIAQPLIIDVTPTTSDKKTISKPHVLDIVPSLANETILSKPSLIDILPNQIESLIISNPHDIEVEPLSKNIDIPFEISVTPTEFNTSIPSNIDVTPVELPKVQISSPQNIELQPLKIKPDIPFEISVSPAEINTSTPNDIDITPIILPKVQISSPQYIELQPLSKNADIPFEISVTPTEFNTSIPSSIDVTPVELPKVQISSPQNIELQPLKIKPDIPFEISVSPTEFSISKPSYINIEPILIDINPLKKTSILEILPVFKSPLLTIPNQIEIALSNILLEQPIKQTIIVEKEVPVEVEKKIYVPVEINKPYEVIKEKEVKIPVTVEKLVEYIKEIPLETIKEVPVEKVVEIIRDAKPEVIDRNIIVKENSVQYINLPPEEKTKYVEVYNEVPVSSQAKSSLFQPQIEKDSISSSAEVADILVEPTKQAHRELNKISSIEVKTGINRKAKNKPYLTLYNGNRPMTSSNIIEKYSLDTTELDKKIRKNKNSKRNKK